MLNVVTVVASAVVLRSAGPSISLMICHGDVAARPAFFSCSQMSDSGICDRMKTTINAGDGPREQQRPESARESGQQRAEAVDQNRDHQQRLATVAIRERAAEHAAD